MYSNFLTEGHWKIKFSLLLGLQGLSLWILGRIEMSVGSVKNNFWMQNYWQLAFGGDQGSTKRLPNHVKKSSENWTYDRILDEGCRKLKFLERRIEHWVVSINIESDQNVPTFDWCHLDSWNLVGWWRTQVTIKWTLCQTNNVNMVSSFWLTKCRNLNF